MTFPIVTITAEEGTAKIVLLEEIYDFKTVSQGTTITHSFKIKNDGNAPLIIHNVHPDCGCTVAESPSEVAPGATAEIHITMDTMDLSGVVNKRILISTNDPSAPETYVYLSGNVKAWVQVLPKPFLVFNQLLSEENEKSVYVVTEMEDKEFQITSTECSLPFIEAISSVLPQDQRFGPFPNKQYLLTLKIKPGAPVGYQKGTLLIHTNVKEQPVKRMFVSTMLRPDVMATPFDIHFGSLTQDQLPVNRLVWVSDNTKKIPDFTVIRIENENPFIQTEITPIPAESRYQIKITLPETAPEGPFLGTLKIHTNAPDDRFKVLTVDFDGEIVKK